MRGCRILWGSALKCQGAAPWLWLLEKGRVAAGAGTLWDVAAVGDTSPWPSWTRLTWVGACGSVCGCAVLCFSVLCFCAMLFYSVLCFCSVLCCSVLCFSLLCCSVFLCSAIFLCCAMFFCAMMFCAVLFCSVLCFCAVPFCSVLCFSVPFCSVLYCVSVPCCVFLCRAGRGCPAPPGSFGTCQPALVEAGSSAPCGSALPSAKTGSASSGFYTWPSRCACGCLEETAGRNISFIPVLSLASHLSLQTRIPVVGRCPILCAPDSSPTKTQQFFTWRPKIQLLPDKAFLS